MGEVVFDYFGLRQDLLFYVVMSKASEVRAVRRLSKKHKTLAWATIKLRPTNERFTQAAGLGSLIEVFEQSSLYRGFIECLPKRISNRSVGAARLGLIQLGSFLYGHDCIEDLEEFRDDPLFEAALKGEVAAPRTICDFLYDFDQDNIDKLNLYLSKMAHAIRKQLTEIQPEEHKPKTLHLSIDSTAHVQEGVKMEGVAFNYDGLWCLDSQLAFDELGLSYGMQLRPGNTKSGVDAEALITQAIGRMEHIDEKIISGDAAYCNQFIIKQCLLHGAKFTLTANDATTGYKDKINQVTDWEPWVYTEEEQKKAAAKKRKLPVIELGRFLWEPSWSDSLKFPIVVKRTWVVNSEPTLFAQANEGHWDHYAVVTNFSLYAHTKQWVIQTHNRRGNAENFIKEEKYGYDLKHFPCQKLMANHAFGLLAQVAHNILRWVALVQRPDKPHFSKKIRRRFIYIPGKIIKHARQLVLKIPTRFYEEVTHLIQALTSKPCPSLDTC